MEIPDHKNSEIQEKPILGKNGVEMVKLTNVDRIVAILSCSCTETKDANELFSILKQDTSHITNMTELHKNGIYILISNLLKLSTKEFQEQFIFILINKAPECPVSAVSLMSELEVFDRPGIYDIPNIQETFLIMKKNYGI